jgi:magnesium transporter
MTLVRQLADDLLERHPTRATIVLEQLAPDEAIRLLAGSSLASAATIVPCLSPHFATAVLRGLTPERAARILDTLEIDTAARLIRRLEATGRAAILDRLQPTLARGVRAVLRFPKGSAGAMMDPDVLALPQTLTAREALQRVRQAPELARYNLYVVDQQQRLIGALNLRELLLARGRAPLSEIMVPNPHRIRASADRLSVLVHPGWREVHALPVVDEADAYLGALRYRTLRELEEALRAPPDGDADASAALGQVFAAGARGVLDALSGTAAKKDPANPSTGPSTRERRQGDG